MIKLYSYIGTKYGLILIYNTLLHNKVSGVVNINILHL